MRKIDKDWYKKEVIRILEIAKKPIWISDLNKKYGLPYVTLFNKNKKSPTKSALHEMIQSKEIYLLAPRYYKMKSEKPRRKIALPPQHPIAKQSRTYFELQLVDKLMKMEQQIKNLTIKLKNNGIN